MLLSKAKAVCIYKSVGEHTHTHTLSLSPSLSLSPAFSNHFTKIGPDYMYQSAACLFYGRISLLEKFWSQYIYICLILFYNCVFCSTPLWMYHNIYISDQFYFISLSFPFFFFFFPSLSCLKHTWPLTSVRVRGTDPHAVKNLHVTL